MTFPHLPITDFVLNLLRSCEYTSERPIKKKKKKTADVELDQNIQHNNVLVV